MKPFKFLNITQDDEAVDIYINGEIIEGDERLSKVLYDWFGIKSISDGEFNKLLNSAGDKPLNIHINSIGGDAIIGIAMYSAIKNYKGKTTAIVDSICASAATLPAMACQKVIMQKPSTMMIHCVSAWGVYGNKQELEKTVGALESLDNSIANAYEEKTGLEREAILKMMEAETWMDSKKALELGFIDEISGQADIPQDVIKNIIDNNKRLVACYRGIEQPTSTEPATTDNSCEDGSKLLNGKFASVEQLQKAYDNLQAEFTKKSQKLAEIEAINKSQSSQASENPQGSADKTKAELELAIAIAKAKTF